MAEPSTSLTDFEDLATLSPAVLQQLVMRVEARMLAVSLKTASDELSLAVFSAFPPPQLGIFQDTLDIIGPIRVAELEAAQAVVLAAAKDLMAAKDTQSSGRLRLIPRISVPGLMSLFSSLPWDMWWKLAVRRVPPSNR